MESEERFRSLCVSSPVGIFLTDTEGRCTYTNPSCQLICGFTLEESLGEGWSRFVHREDREQVFANWVKHTRAGREYSQEFRFQHPRGNMRWVHVRSAPMFSEEGHLVGHTGTVEDITERKETEQALRDSESKYRMLMEQASDGIHTYDLEGNFIEVNTKLCEMLGYTCEELLRLNVRDLIPAGDLATAPISFEELRAGKTIISERRLRHKDGTLLPVEISGKMLPNGELQAIIRDITKRKQAEEAIRFQSHLLDTVEQAVIATDVSGIIIYWNRFAEKLYGWPAAEITGHNIIEVTPTQAANDEAAKIMSRLQAGQSWSGEFKVRRRDDTTFPAFITNTPIYDNAGTMIGIVGVSNDITGRKRAEERLRESEERHRAIVEQTMVGVAHCDLSGKLTIVNQKYCDITGYTKSELLTRRMQDITHPDDLPLNVEQFARLVGEGTPLEIEKRYICKDGSIIWVSIGASAILDREGKTQSTVAAVLDITERKRTERLLDAQKQSLEMLVGGASLNNVLTYLARVVEQQAEGRAVASILLLDEQGCLRNGASPSLPEDYLKAIDGLKADPHVGTCSAAAALGTVIITPDIAADPKWQDYKHLPLGLGFQAAWSMPIMARDGSVLGTFGTYFRERREPELLERQAVGILARTAALAIERTRAEDALRESEERLRAIFEASRDGILVEDDERISYVNKSYTRLLGYESSEELIGKHISAVISTEDVERLLEFGRRRARSELVASVYEFKGKRKDGTLIDVEASVSTSTVAGRPYITTMVRDIAERKQAEEALRQAHDGLERRVAERTAELAHINEALEAEICERKQAEAARRQLLGQLVTAQEDERRRISRELHDQMGQHLAAIVLLVNSLKEFSQPDPSAISRISQLEEVANQLSQEVDTLAWELRPTVLDDLGLHVALGNYVEKWSKRAHVPVDFHSTGLSEQRLPPPLETAIYRIVQEALTNILKHARASNVSLILERRDNHVSVIIEDDGCGFDIEALLATPVVERRMGLLGMQERATLVGGTLNIESAPGAGITIFMRVPVTLDEHKGSYFE